jgi:hypothetical protein
MMRPFLASFIFAALAALPAAAQTNVLDHPLEDYQQCT